jgi:hypothetical protein
MAIVSFELGKAVGAVIVAAKRTAQSASDRRKDNLIGKKDGLIHSQISVSNARMTQIRSTFE